MLEIIIGCGVCILLLILLIIIYHNKFQYVIIKIEEAENNICVLLDKKQELLNRARPIIKKELKLDESLVGILEELGDNEDMIVGSINYYNDSVVSFNKLVMSFPAKIVAFLFRYKKKEFHNNEKKEMYQILNEK